MKIKCKQFCYNIKIIMTYLIKLITIIEWLILEVNKYNYVLLMNNELYDRIDAYSSFNAYLLTF